MKTTSRTAMITHPLKPVYERDARVLILGSIPGRVSLAEKQYYAHPRNQFWDIMGVLVGAGRAMEYENRLACLRNRGIACWDVIAACRRKGSLDADITSSSVVFQDVKALVEECNDLRAVVCNGQTAARHFLRLLARERVLRSSYPWVVHALPSTSPAHACLSLEEKVNRWQVILQYL